VRRGARLTRRLIHRRLLTKPTPPHRTARTLRSQPPTPTAALNAPARRSHPAHPSRPSPARPPGKFLRDNCPNYLREANFAMLKEGAVERLTVSTNFFMDELKARIYTKVSSRQQCKGC
jgi:hypothetical protein